LLLLAHSVLVGNDFFKVDKISMNFFWSVILHRSIISLLVTSTEIFMVVMFCGIFIALMLYFIWMAAQIEKDRRIEYLAPEIAIESHGIKRGLTAVEAAVLMDQPKDKILTMILFAVVKKGATMVLNCDPLEIEVADPLPEGLRLYEFKFL
jgi:hypothetical protein